jgi:S-adenosyl methyltransferase
MAAPADKRAGDPYGIVSSLLPAVPPGSYLALSQVASDVAADQVAEARRQFNQRSHQQQRHSSRDEVARFFAGLDLVPPSVVLVQQWRPGSDEEAAAQSTMWCGLARKP